MKYMSCYEFAPNEEQTYSSRHKLMALLKSHHNVMGQNKHSTKSHSDVHVTRNRIKVKLCLKRMLNLFCMSKI